MQEHFPVYKINEVFDIVKAFVTDSLADRDKHSDNSLVCTTCLGAKMKYDAREIRQVTNHEGVR